MEEKDESEREEGIADEIVHSGNDDICNFCLSVIRTNYTLDEPRPEVIRKKRD
jgi:hypothetical protein